MLFDHKSDNLQYNTLGRLDERLIDQASDVPSIIFKLAVRAELLGTEIGVFFCIYLSESEVLGIFDEFFDKYF